MSVSETDERPLGELIDAAQRGARNDWEKTFVADLAERFEQWGPRLHVSIKQVTKLRDIASRGELENDVQPPSPYIDTDTPVPDVYATPAPTLERQQAFASVTGVIESYCNDTAMADDVARAVVKAASGAGWRFVPEKPTEAMKGAWANKASVFPGSSAARAHCEIVYREMLQHAPAFAPDKGAP